MIGFYFSGAGGTFQLPVNPAELTVKYDGSNQRTEVVKLGEINILRGAKLAAISLDFLLPGDDYYPFITGAWQAPAQIIAFFKCALDNHKPLRFIVSEFNLNMQMSVESLSEQRVAGDHDSVRCSLSLLQYRAYGARTVKVSVKTASKTVTTKRPVEKPEVKSYTVKPGDSFWRIAQQQLGNGSRYAELAKYNGMTAASVIHPGDTLKLPAR